MSRFWAITDPVTRKRLRRFRQRRRAWWSFWALAAMYAASLAAGLIANDRPLVVRCRGRLRFPVLFFYPESAFVPGGRLTRPDYKVLRRDPRFADVPGNGMIFPPVPYGPHEIVREDALESGGAVEASFTPAPRVAAVNLLPDLRIASAAAAESFFPSNTAGVAGTALGDVWRISPDFAAAVAARFANRAAPAWTGAAASALDAERRIQVSLAAFEARETPPRTVRATLQAGDASAQPVTMRFGRDGPREPAPDLWRQLGAADRALVLARVATCFGGQAEPVTVEAGRALWRVRLTSLFRFPHPPVRGHWFGLDSAGRDVFVRILHGLRISMTFGFLLVVCSMLFGIVIGAVQGYYGGAVDITAQRLIEIWSALPFLYIMILMGSVYGRSFGLLLACYAIFNWIGISYYMRGEFLRLRGQPFVDAARCLGIPPRKIMFRHILPNALTPVITFFPFSLVGAIGSLAALDFLGFGLPPPAPSWGELLYQAHQFRWAWWLILYPSLALFTVMLLGVFVGEGVRDAYDPRPFSRME